MNGCLVPDLVPTSIFVLKVTRFGRLKAVYSDKLFEFDALLHLSRAVGRETKHNNPIVFVCFQVSNTTDNWGSQDLTT